MKQGESTQERVRQFRALSEPEKLSLLFNAHIIMVSVLYVEIKTLPLPSFRARLNNLKIKYLDAHQSVAIKAKRRVAVETRETLMEGRPSGSGYPVSSFQMPGFRRKR